MRTSGIALGADRLTNGEIDFGPGSSFGYFIPVNIVLRRRRSRMPTMPYVARRI